MIARTRRAVGGDQRCSPRARGIRTSGFVRFSATKFQEALEIAPDVLLLPSTAPTDQRGNPPVLTRLVTLVGDEIAHLVDRSTDDDLAS